MGMDCQLHGPLDVFPRLMHRQAAEPAPDQDMEAQRCSGCCIAPWLSAQELFYGLNTAELDWLQSGVEAPPASS